MSNLNITNKVTEVAKADIEELNNKIDSFNSGKEDEEKFRSFRLSRGVYGQRQEGVQMIRIKLPFGRVSAKQLTRIADVADKYATEKMHATTRQDFQIHYVKLADSPQLWADLEDAGITLKEACGNTVRNVTASADAGVNPKELFDVSPYAHGFFNYFLRNPICQEMGRKIKVAFSATDADTAYTFMHDIGFLPRLKNGVKGFKVVVGGGLGSQPMIAHEALEFVPVNEFLPYSEAIIRVFDRYGERASRGKARMKFLIKDIGFDAFVKLVEEEKKSCINKKFSVDLDSVQLAGPVDKVFEAEEPRDIELYTDWVKGNTFDQKQEGYKGAYIKLTLGNIFNETARGLSKIVSEGYCADDMRITVNQGILLKYVKKENLIPLFNRLYDLDLVDVGFDSTGDITACPGTDTCNLGIGSSTGLSRELERVIKEEYEELLFNHDIKIKISGCMNACGQHSIANIGFQGMTIKKGAFVMPAVQVLLGGGFNEEGEASIADKVLKVPSKVAPDTFKALLKDFEENALDGEYYNNYYQRQIAEDKMYFFTVLKPFTSLDNVTDEFYVDWGEEAKYVKAIGVGECAGVVLDLVGTLIEDAKEKFDKAIHTLENGNWQDSIYHSYNAFVVGGKALLMGEGLKCNTQITLIKDFDTEIRDKGFTSFLGKSFEETVLQINKNEPSLEFAQAYFEEAKNFIINLDGVRKSQIERFESQEA